MSGTRWRDAGVVVLLVVAAGLGLGAAPGAATAAETDSGGPIVARPGATEVLDLEACVEAALVANDRLVAERMRRSELDGQMKQALSTGLPTLDLVGDWTRGRDPSFALDETFGGGDGFGVPAGADPWFNDWLMGFGSFIPEPGEIQPQTFWGANANLNWTINPTQILGAVGAARLGIDRQELQVQSLEQSTADQTLGAYFGIVAAAERLAAVEAELASQTELLAIMKLRHELGLVTRLDTLQAAVTRANITPRVGVAEAGLRNAGSRLNALMGRAPEMPLSIAGIPEPEDDLIVETVALKLAQERPDLVAGDLFVDILRRNRQAQVADNRPYITIFGSYGYVGKDLDTMFDDGHDSWRLSAALNIPIFDGLNTRGRVDETKARIRRQEAELSGTRRDVQVEVMEVLANLRSARGVLDAANLNLERSQEVLDESLLMLELGKTSYLDVLVAESNRAQARSNVIDARQNVLVLTSNLKRAVGYSPLLPLRAVPGLTGEETR